MNIFIIDDSAIYRRAITEALREPGIQVLGSSANGKLALERLVGLESVDLVICDMEMPEMNGLEFIQKFRAVNRSCKILVFSSLSERGAKITIDALLAGANDFLPKSFGSKDGDKDPIGALKENLLPKVRQFEGTFVKPTFNEGPQKSEGLKPAPIKFVKNSGFSSKPDIICIGSSTGGPDALKSVLSQIDKDFSVPILIAQHMPALFTKELAKLLDRSCSLEVKEADEGELIVPGKVYIAPGDFHMRVKKMGQNKILTMDQSEKVNFVRPAVDILFNSVSDVYGGSAVAVILTGMGHDGREGVKYMKSRHNVPVIIQDKDSCVVFGMPGAIYESELYDQMLPLNEIPIFLNKLLKESISLTERLGA